MNVTPRCSDRGANNFTPLYAACERSDVEPAKVLIRNGADVNARASHGVTPLDWAISWSRRRLVPILLRAGAALPAETDDAYLRKVIAAGGFRIRAQPPQRPHRDLRPEVRPPPAGDGPPRRRVRVPHGGLLRKYGNEVSYVDERGRNDLPAPALAAAAAAPAARARGVAGRALEDVQAAHALEAHLADGLGL